MGDGGCWMGDKGVRFQVSGGEAMNSVFDLGGENMNYEP